MHYSKLSINNRRLILHLTLRVAALLYCIVLYLQPVLNPESYDGARVLEASGRPMLVIGRSYVFDSIQDGETAERSATTLAGDALTTKLADETMEKSNVEA